MRRSSLIALTLAVTGCLLCLCMTAGLGVAGALWYYGTQEPAVAVASPVPPAVPPPVTVTVPPAATRAAPSATATAAQQPSATPPRPASPTVLAVADEAAMTLAALGETTIPPRDLFALAVRFGRIPPGSARTVAGPAYVLGDQSDFTVSGDASTFQVRATLRAQTAHASWWVQNEYEVAEAELQASALIFEETTYPTVHRYFGEEWSPGVDEDVRVHIFLGDVPGVGGYFSSADEFPRTVFADSNEREMFYISLDNAQPGESYFDGVLAHEFQHMVHWNVDRNEEIWVNEGLSELAAFLSGFEVGSSLNSYTRDTDLPVTRWEDQSHPFYSSAYLFMLYFYEQFGEAPLRAFVQHPDNGPVAFDAVLAPLGSSFDQLFADWVAATLLDGEAVGQPFEVAGERVPRPAPARVEQQFPLVARGDVHQYGTDGLAFDAGTETSTLRLGFTGERSVPLLPTEPHSGRWMLWSNRSDDSDVRLVQPFDLSGVERATLRFWTWFELEPDYDFGYVVASINGGATWQILPVPENSALSDPFGNTFGPALGSRSGRAEGDEGAARWVEMEVDLSRFAGQQILLGFQVVTDDALTESGVVVDDISIPELGYQEDFEQGLGGWQPDGWTRIANALPQRWVVQAIAEGPGGIERFPMTLDAANSGELSLPGFGEQWERVTLLVSGATHDTAERAGYSFSARVEP